MWYDPAGANQAGVQRSDVGPALVSDLNSKFDDADPCVSETDP